MELNLMDLRFLTGFKNPHRILDSSKDLILLTGFEGPHRI
jgi:hypothetical protein